MLAEEAARELVLRLDPAGRGNAVSYDALRTWLSGDDNSAFDPASRARCHVSAPRGVMTVPLHSASLLNL